LYFFNCLKKLINKQDAIYPHFIIEQNYCQLLIPELKCDQISEERDEAGLNDD